MATFVYSPAIRVHVETEDHGILDISDDISQWELVRRTNLPSSFTFVLQNTQRKYDRAFRPSDRITVELKRITWVRVFTGSLNNVPIFSAWPRALTLSATCSLKKLQFWPWDPTTNESSNMIIQFMNKMNGNQKDITKGDRGLSGLIAESLVRVTGWDEKAIHIGAVPNAWFKWAQKTELAVDAASNMAAVLGPSSVGGQSQAASLAPGKFGGTPLDQGQLDIAKSIFSAIVTQPTLTSVALQNRAATITFMVALDESSLTNLSGGDRDSVGVFQQRASYGTAVQRQQVDWAISAFLKGCPATGADGTTAGGHIPGLLDTNWKTNPNLGLVADNVQRSGDPSGSNYAAFQPVAEALVQAFRATPGGTGAQSSPVDPTGLHETGRTSFRGTGNMVAKVASDLITVLNTPPNIKYAWPYSLRSDPRSDHPTYLDCSGLVLWVLYHTTSVVWSAGTSQAQYADCPVRDIDMKYAKDIRGCLLFGNGDNSGPFSAPDHVGIALGDGHSHVAAHTNDAPLAQQVDISDLPAGLYSGALAPHIDYTAAATTEAARKHLQSLLGKPCTLAPPLAGVGTPSTSDPTSDTGGGSDPFAQLVSVLNYAPQINGDIFGGSRQLINNQPFLPWLANVTNSSMRAFCSAPNGDFIAWFPDYFNVWNTAAVMDIKLIELKDFTVEWSDQQMVTHEFVLGSIAPTLQTASGSIADGGLDSYSGIYAMLGTEGIATMDFPQIFTTIYGKAASSAFVADYLKRFGARPNVEAMPNVIHGAQEFYMALWMFMKHWAEQFNATVPMTFMPEIWPGMILRIQEYGFQAYVSEVTHRGSYGPQGQFTTEAKIIAPAPIDLKTRGSLFGMLDVFGDDTKKKKGKKG